MSKIEITYTFLTTNQAARGLSHSTTQTGHLVVAGASDKEAHLNYLAARGQLTNPLYNVTECRWVD